MKEKGDGKIPAGSSIHLKYDVQPFSDASFLLDHFLDDLSGSDAAFSAFQAVLTIPSPVSSLRQPSLLGPAAGCLYGSWNAPAQSLKTYLRERRDTADKSPSIEMPGCLMSSALSIFSMLFPDGVGIHQEPRAVDRRLSPCQNCGCFWNAPSPRKDAGFPSPLTLCAL